MLQGVLQLGQIVNYFMGLTHGVRQIICLSLMYSINKDEEGTNLF